ncbi:Tfp pilus assembly protein PilF [Anabaena sp. FACHB-1237]|uniref:tetratricopeptide repeat protein n=1 Tax=Anabaena sp. FACHB-1237 TaxID=2692769 RepID=UPI0016813002|nr:Tfp pilus assembly protein PilF [Anabaena sp. FACHB-1237]MBD2137049.1 Tfp pilus assembly protein PilF [Anabaena sp. FACHB-1237]
MSNTNNRLLVRVILIVAVLGFLGVSLIPILAPLSSPHSSATNSSNSGENTSSFDQKSKIEDEIRGYESVLKKEPENQTALKGLLQSRLQLLSQKKPGEVKPADIQVVIEPLEKLAKLNPENSEYAVLLAQAKEQIGDKEGAAQSYRAVLATKAGDLKALQGMVKLQLSQKRPEAAIGLLQDTLAAANQANAIKPDAIDVVAVQILLGTVYGFQNKDKEAIAVYDEAIKKDAEDFRPVLAKAMFFKDRGKVDEAKPLFASAVALAPAQYKDEINKAAGVVSSPDPTPSGSPSP